MHGWIYNGLTEPSEPQPKTLAVDIVQQQIDDNADVFESDKPFTSYECPAGNERCHCQLAYSEGRADRLLESLEKEQ